MRTNLLFIILIAFTSIASAQGNRKYTPIREKIKTQRIAFITERLNLSASEAEKFWPVYNKFTSEMEEIKDQQHQKRKLSNETLNSMSDKDVEKNLDDLISLQQSTVDLQRKYQTELKKVISPKKILMLYSAERDFKMELLKKVRQNGERPSKEMEIEN